jgi:hypothetical protein
LLVHIGDPPTNQAASLESQMIPTIQYVPGRALRRKGTAVEFLKDKVDEIHRHYVKTGLNNAQSMPDIESIQFFDSIAVIRKKKQLPRFHVKNPPESNQ